MSFSLLARNILFREVPKDYSTAIVGGRNLEIRSQVLGALVFVGAALLLWSHDKLVRDPDKAAAATQEREENSEPKLRRGLMPGQIITGPIHKI